MKSYYQILGVAETATDAEIKKVFRKLARETHPDTHPGDASAEARFKEVSEAYETLGDPAKRKRYDEARVQRRVGKGPTKATPKNPFDVTMDFGDIFSDLAPKEKANKQGTPAGKDKQNPLNADDMFAKFMGFKPKGG